MSPPTLVVSASDIARDLDLDPEDERTRHVLETAIATAQAQVETYLGRPIVPRTYTDRDRSPAFPSGWHLVHEPVREILSVEPQLDHEGHSTGLFLVTYIAGLNAAAEEGLDPVRRYVAQQTKLDPEVRRLRRTKDPMYDRVISSVSVEGQSVSYEKSTGGGGGSDGGGGGVLTLESLDFWRVARRRVSSGRSGRRWPR